MPGRVLLKEGFITIIGKKSGKERKFYLFVFNDVILASKQTLAKKKIFDHTVRYDVLVNG
jgi:hypothetical protein